MLQVPYLAQSELLCGGAAIAMVERWWGRRGVYAEDFAHLVFPGAAGIATTDLADATRARGWQTDVVRGTVALVQRSLADSVPVVALIQVAPDRYHYVVIVGWDAEQVVFHDPAVRPFATLPTKKFLQQWREADDWVLLIRPAPVVAIPEHSPPVQPDSLPCRPWLDRAVDAALASRLNEAERMLASARNACPAEAIVLRELAGVRFRQGRYAEASRLAEEFLGRVPDDSLGWQLVASSRYLAGDGDGALDAWNAVGQPTVDLVRIDGSNRVRFRVITDVMGVPPAVVLTSVRLALATRRITDIPALASARVSYAVVPGGAVEVRAAVVERPSIPSFPRLLVAGALRAAVRQEATLTIATPLGAGERWTAEWRWDPAEPRRAIHLEMPARLGRPGIVMVNGSAEEYRFGGDSSVRTAALEHRRATTFGVRSWVHGQVEALAGARFESWSTEGDFLALSVGVALHGLGDRVVAVAQGEQAMAFTDRPGYARILARANWISSQASSAVQWSARVGVEGVSGGTPRGLWPIAGGDIARAIPLRAHPRVVDGSLSGERTAQTIVHGGVAGDHHAAMLGPLELTVGIFLDAADVIRRDRGVTERHAFLDAGAGLSVGLLGSPSTALRIDLARGLLADQRWGLGVGFQHAWPVRVQHFR